MCKVWVRKGSLLILGTVFAIFEQSMMDTLKGTSEVKSRQNTSGFKKARLQLNSKAVKMVYKVLIRNRSSIPFVMLFLLFPE